MCKKKSCCSNRAAVWKERRDCTIPPAPMDSPQDTAESTSKTGGGSGKELFKKGQKTLDRQRRREKRVKNHSASTKVREDERRGGGEAAACEGTSRLNRWIVPEGAAACREPMLDQILFLRNVSLWESPHCKRRKWERKGATARKCYLLTSTYIPPHTVHGQGRGIWSEGLKLSFKLILKLF